MSRNKQQTFGFAQVHWKHRYSYGGKLRRVRRGRGARPLSSKNTLHLVLKANGERIRNGFRIYKRYFLILDLLQRYSRKFFIKIDQFSIQNDHIHLHIRTSKRSQYQSFFRVFAGQIAQQFEKEGLLSVPSSVTDTPTKSSKASGKRKVTDTPKSSKSLELKQDLQSEVGSEGGDGSEKKAQRLIRKLWQYRPFTRVVIGQRGFLNVRNYIRLNEKEALGEIPYRKQRLRGLSAGEWAVLWS